MEPTVRKKDLAQIADYWGRSHNGERVEEITVMMDANRDYTLQEVIDLCPAKEDSINPNDLNWYQRDIQRAFNMVFEVQNFVDRAYRSRAASKCWERGWVPTYTGVNKKAQILPPHINYCTFNKRHLPTCCPSNYCCADKVYDYVCNYYSHGCDWEELFTELMRIWPGEADAILYMIIENDRRTKNAEK